MIMMPLYKVTYVQLMKLSVRVRLLLSLSHKLPYHTGCITTLTLDIEDQITTACTKYIELDCHFVQENVAVGSLVSRYIHSESQIPDIFAKVLFKDSHALRIKLRVQPPLPSYLSCSDTLLLEL